MDKGAATARGASCGHGTCGKAGPQWARMSGGPRVVTLLRQFAAPSGDVGSPWNEATRDKSLALLRVDQILGAMEAESVG